MRGCPRTPFACAERFGGKLGSMEQQPSGGRALVLILLAMAAVFAVIVGFAMWAAR
ncbi:hypothetical protein GCM10017673_25530 [Streptosporangium violaceochromogenes]|nr:hypothetical protein GCM10017673_25530 [Streptosporangium violaceochromogenes]